MSRTARMPRVNTDALFEDPPDAAIASDEPSAPIVPRGPRRRRSRAEAEPAHRGEAQPPDTPAAPTSEASESPGVDKAEAPVAPATESAAGNGREAGPVEPQSGFVEDGGGSERAAAVPSARPSAPDDEANARLDRIEESIHAIRRCVERQAREERYSSFSLPRLIGSLLQILVIALVLAALCDWLFAGPPVQLFTKLAFAGVVQLAALTAFVLGRAGEGE